MGLWSLDFNTLIAGPLWSVSGGGSDQIREWTLVGSFRNVSEWFSKEEGMGERVKGTACW